MTEAPWPKIGFGTWQLEGEIARKATASALAAGYRHVDTAEMYANEEMVGRAIAESGVPRGDIFLTTKVWWTNLAPDALARAMEASLKKLRTDYVDLYLIHWPAPKMDLRATLDAMLRLREEGRTRAIGVANFPVALLRRAVEEIGVPIACDQVEYHAMLGQTALLRYARAKGVPIVAYCPLARGGLAADPTLGKIAKKHDASIAEIALAWLLDQEGVTAIPRSRSPEHQKENLGACRVTLDDSDRAAIARLPKDRRCVNPAHSPVWDEAG